MSERPRAKGLHERVVIYKHALRNALIPTVTVIGIYMSILMGGSVLTEIIYSRPGLGKMMVFAVKDRDYIMLQSVIIIFSAFVFLFFNLLTDLLYSLHRSEDRVSLKRLLCPHRAKERFSSGPFAIIRPQRSVSS